MFIEGPRNFFWAQLRPRLALAVSFFLSFETSWGRELNNPCTAAALGEDISLVNLAVQRAIDTGHWGKAYNLRVQRNPIVVVTPKAILLYGQGGSATADPLGAASAFFNVFLNELTDHSVPRCSGQAASERIPAAAILIEPERLGMQAPILARPYGFVYENSEETATKPRRLVKLSELLGPYLVVNLRDFSPQSLIDLGRTIVHEGAHLFGQSAVSGAEPSSALLSRNSREDIEARINESEYAQLVFREGRYAAWTLKKILIQSSGLQQALPKTECDSVPIPVDRSVIAASPMSRLNLQQHFDSLYSCIVRRNVGTIDPSGQISRIGRNELYWYFVEGIPQYLEHQYVLESTSSGLSQSEAVLGILKQFERFCTSINGGDIVRGNLAFHPLMLGSVFVHVLERIYGGRNYLEEKFGFDLEGINNWFTIGSSYQRLVSSTESVSFIEAPICH